MHETYFLAGIITREIYEVYPNIEYVTFDSRHLLENVSIITIQDINANDKMIESCNSIIKKLNTINEIISL